MGVVLIKHLDSITVDLGGLSKDRVIARIRLLDIRSVTKMTDNMTVQIIFSSNETYSFPFIGVTSVDGDEDMGSQDKLYNKMCQIIFE
jgi:hypothetical protein